MQIGVLGASFTVQLPITGSAKESAICAVDHLGIARRRNTALQTATATAARRVAVRLRGRTGGARQMLAEMAPRISCGGFPDAVVGT